MDMKDLKNIIIIDKFSFRYANENDENSFYASIKDLERIGIDKCFDLKQNCIIDYLNIDQELANIKQWFADNDWKVNKVFIGEWTTDDERWLDYLAERAIKRARQDELLEMLGIIA